MSFLPIGRGKTNQEVHLRATASSHLTPERSHWLWPALMLVCCLTHLRLVSPSILQWVWGGDLVDAPQVRSRNSQSLGGSALHGARLPGMLSCCAGHPEWELQDQPFQTRQRPTERFLGAPLVNLAWVRAVNLFGSVCWVK